MSRPLKKEKSYQAHGLNALKERLKRARVTAGRSWLEALGAEATAILEFKQDCIADMGGPEAVSKMAESVLDVALQSKLLVAHCDAFMKTLPSLINRSRRQLYPIVKERQELAEGFVRHMTKLGLEKRRRQKPTYEALWQAADDGKDANPSDSLPAVRENTP